MEKKKQSKKWIKLKKFSNILWLIGTISALLFIIIAIIVIARTNYHSNVKDDVLSNLSRYNAVKFGYIQETKSITNTENVVADVPDELLDVLDNIKADNIQILDTYNQVSVRIKEPLEDVDSVVGRITSYTDYWQIVKEGITYHGTPETGTVSEEELELVLSEATNVDEFLTNLSNTIVNNTDKIVLFGDVNYGKLVLTEKLCTGVKSIIEGTDETEKLLLELQLLSEIGEYTPALNTLYDLYFKLQ